MKTLIPVLLLVVSCVAAAVYQPHRRNAFRPSVATVTAPTIYSISTNNVTYTTNRIQISNDAGSGANRLRLVFVITWDFITSDDHLVAYDGTTQMINLGWTNYYNLVCEMAAFYNINPVAGSSVISITNTAGNSTLAVLALTINGANQVNPIGTVTKTNANNFGTNIAVSAVNNLNFSYSGFNNGNNDNVTNSVEQTLRGKVQTAAFEGQLALTTQPGIDTSVVDIFNWSRSQSQCIMSFAVKP